MSNTTTRYSMLKYLCSAISWEAREDVERLRTALALAQEDSSQLKTALSQAEARQADLQVRRGCTTSSLMFISVLDLVSQVRDVVLMNVYLDLGDPGGSGFRNEGYTVWARGGKLEDQFTSNLGTRWTDPITARRVPSK
jgi:hypothetical protein